MRIHNKGSECNYLNAPQGLKLSNVKPLVLRDDTCIIQYVCGAMRRADGEPILYANAFNTIYGEPGHNVKER